MFQRLRHILVLNQLLRSSVLSQAGLPDNRKATGTDSMKQGARGKTYLLNDYPNRLAHRNGRIIFVLRVWRP